MAKLNGTGSELAYATFLGGSGDDYGYGIAMDGAGRAYVTGDTVSSGFPTTPGAFDTSFNGDSNDAFVVKLAMGTETVPLSGPLSVISLYPPPAQPSTIMRGGQAHRYFEVRDTNGRLAPFVTVTFAPIGSGTSDANGLLDVAFDADSLGGPGSYTPTATDASRWDQVFTLASPVSFSVQVQERPFQHHWYGGTVLKGKGGVSAGLVAFLEGQTKGGLGWELEETDAGSTSDDRLRLTEQFQGEVGGGAGLGAKVGAKAIISSAEAGAEATTELKGLAQGEWQSRFNAPYTEPEQKAQAVFVLSGLLDMAPGMPAAPALAATIRALGPSVNYASYQEKEVSGIGAEWTPAHVHAGAGIEFLGRGGDTAAAQGTGTTDNPVDEGFAKPLLAPDINLNPSLKLDALDAETTLRLFGTYSEDYIRNEWSLALDQEVGFDLDLLAMQTVVTQKVGAYVGDHSTKLKEDSSSVRPPATPCVLSCPSPARATRPPSLISHCVR